ncbi:MAG: sigma 54-interacting transcriptional regulator [Myxococcales bacterium]|nr:sigma 54-interacting transcriptional regulator [Myxococcales bacterium]
MTIDKDEFFHRVTKAITGTLDIEKGLDQCFRLLQKFMPVNQMNLLLYDSSVGMMKLLAGATNMDVPFSHQNIVALPEIARQFVDRLLVENKPFITSINGLDDLLKIGFSSGDYDQMGIPIEFINEMSRFILGLFIEGKNVAFLEVSTFGLNHYTEEHGQLLLLLNEPLAIAVDNYLTHQEVLKLKAMLEDDNRFLQAELHHLIGDQIIGVDMGLRPVMDMVEQVASKNSPVMLFGETGVGKDLIANAIHDASPRRNGPFIKVNCGAIPENLIDSELFGHEKGAFTGAIARKRGRFERADQGTIFLDEIGELPLPAQVHLLRVIQNKEFERVGGTEILKTDVRIISATNRNIEDMVSARQFREDLYFRLNVFPILIPPLRHRKTDIPALAQYFIERKVIDLKIAKTPSLAPGALRRLMEHKWPGNVRELENLIERELILNKGPVLEFPSLTPVGDADLVKNGKAAPQAARLDEAMADHIQYALSLAKGKVHGKGGAAEILGINPSTLRSRMKKLGIPYGRK